MLLTIGGIGEFLLGNTFPMCVFFGYGAHFFTFATVFIPYYGAIAFPAASGGTSPADAPYDVTATWANSFGFYPIALGMLSFIFLICSLRTNAIFVAIFIFATIGFGFASASLWYTGQGQAATGVTMIVGCGACFFAADLLGWYLFAAIMFATMELPLPDLPVFDLSTVVKAKSRAKQE